MARTEHVGELVELFREALTALEPHFERAGLPWREAPGDHRVRRVAAALYYTFVLEPIAAALSADPETLIENAPAYGWIPDNYVQRPFVRVRAPDGSSGHKEGALVEFRTERDPFDTVCFMPIDMVGGEGIGQPMEARSDLAHYDFVERPGPGDYRIVEEVEVG